MRNSRFLPVALLAVVLSALVGGFFGSVARPAGRGDAAIPRLHRRAGRHRPGVRRGSALRPPGLRRDRRHAPDARSALELLRSPAATRRCASGRKARYYGLGITIQAIDGDITVMSIFEGSPAFKKGLRRGDVIARIEGGRRARAGPASRSGQAAQGTEGHTVNISIKRRGYDQLIDLEVERDEVNIVTRPRRVHDRRRDRLHQARRVLRDLRPARSAPRSSS